VPVLVGGVPSDIGVRSVIACTIVERPKCKPTLKTRALPGWTLRVLDGIRSEQWTGSDQNGWTICSGICKIVHEDDISALERGNKPAISSLARTGIAVVAQGLSGYFG